MSGEIECMAKMWRKGGRWCIEFAELPEWVTEDVVKDAQNTKRGIVINTAAGALHVAAVAVVAGAAEEKVEAGPRPVAARPLPEKSPVQVLPAGLNTGGKPLVVTPNLSPDCKMMPGGKDPYREGADYIRWCHVNTAEIAISHLRNVTGLSASDCDRLIIRVLSGVTDQILTDPVAVAMVNREKAQNPISRTGRAGRAPGFKMTEEAKEKQRQTIAAKRAAQGPKA